MRPDVEALVSLGRLSSEASVDDLMAQEQLLAATEDHLLDADELDSLLGILPANDDDAFGLAWTVLHRLEASPAWPTAALEEAPGYWADVLRQRLSDPATSRDIPER